MLLFLWKAVYPYCLVYLLLTVLNRRLRGQEQRWEIRDMIVLSVQSKW